MDEQSIFCAAIEKSTPVERKRFLCEACQGDEDLRRSVDLLIRAHKKAGSFLQDTRVSIRPTDTVSIGELPGTTIGRYKLVHEIGRGGMGVVYMAAQSQPIKRNVALKIIKPGMDTRDVVSRFEAERQALALMDHPNIAHVLDGGSTDSGRPYFVMELVEGTPITDYCDESRYTTRQRLELFVQVCQAVQHAHQKGIIHRDIKPSNVMVTTADETVVPKVIDFGIAKAVCQPLTEQSLHTHATQIIGTPLYMSPEQAQLGGQDVDTRTDVYSLGVVLYQLLTGTTPFDKERMDRSGLDEVRRIIREEEPPRPSNRLSTIDTALETIAEKHNCDPQSMTRELVGELDWIVIKCLEKDRTRRYESASALATDVQRYLDGDLVQACPPSPAYRLRKFARRHRVAIVTAALIACSMLIGTGASLWQAAQAEEAKSQAVAESVKAKAAKDESEANLAAALDAIEKLLKHSSDPELVETPRAQAIRMRILTDALAFYQRFKSSSGVSPDVRFRAGMTRVELGKLMLDYRDWEKGYEVLQQASDELEQLVKERPTETPYRAGFANALGEYARSHQWSYLGDAARKNRRLTEAVGIRGRQKETYERLLQADPSNRAAYQFAILEAEVGRAKALSGLGDQRLAESILESVRDELHRQSPEPGSSRARLLAHATSTLAGSLRASDPDRAKELLRESIKLGRNVLMSGATRRERNRQISRLGGYFARYLMLEGSPEERDEAQQCAEEAVELSGQLVKDYPNIRQYHFLLHNNCLLVLKILGRKITYARSSGDDQAAMQLTETDANLRAQFVRDYGVHSHLAYLQAKDPNNIERLSESIARYPDISEYFGYRGKIYREQGKLNLALADLDRAIDLLPKHALYPYMPTSPCVFYRERGELHFGRGNYEQAVKDYTTHFTVILARAHDNDYIYKRRAAGYFELNRFDAALADLNRALEIRPDDLSALTWISPAKLARCHDAKFRTAVLQLADRAVELNDGSVASRLVRSSLLLEMGQMEKARADLSAIMKADVTANYESYLSALLALKLGDIGAYQELCQDYVSAAEKSDEPMAMHFAAWSAALVPDSLNDYEPAIALAKASVEAASNDRQFQTGLAAIQMRAGLYEQALASLEKSKELESNTKGSDAYVAFFQAITQHHLGRTTLARESLAEATALADQELSDETRRPSWNRMLTLKLLRNEAETLLKKAEHHDAEPTDKPEEPRSDETRN